MRGKQGPDATVGGEREHHPDGGLRIHAHVRTAEPLDRDRRHKGKIRITARPGVSGKTQRAPLVGEHAPDGHVTVQVAPVFHAERSRGRQFLEVDEAESEGDPQGASQGTADMHMAQGAVRDRNLVVRKDISLLRGKCLRVCTEHRDTQQRQDQYRQLLHIHHGRLSDRYSGNTAELRVPIYE